MVLLLSNISLIVEPIVATLDKSDGTIILVDCPSAKLANASNPFKVRTELSALASFNNLMPSASACFNLISASASPSAIFI